MPQIEIHPLLHSEAQDLYGINHAYFTESVWQMDRRIDAGTTLVQFNQIQLPRRIVVDYPKTLDERMVENQQAEIILASYLNQKAVGYIALKTISERRQLQIVDFVVQQKVRQQGIGTALLAAAHEYARDQGCQRTMLETQSKNFPAICLARKFAYEFCGYHDHYYANHDIALFFTAYLR
ncbi:MAG: GNAT family N-acetyltransferase [Anaerolineaceae bacterium]|nr:GNAT family N-acetyltransferase [Anaerolineaceae bacterium]